MKYGLREDNSFRKKEECHWKNVVENEIKNLKKEVELGKKQLQELNSKIQFLAPSSLSISSIYKFTGKDDHEWDLPAGGTRLFKYRDIHENLLRSNYLCATIMPEYSSWSLEELRLADYLIANFPQRCQFVNDDTWHHSENESPRAADMKQTQQNNHPSIPDMSSASTFCFNQTGIPSKVEDVRALNKYEELLGKVVSELKCVNMNINSVHSRLVAVEANMSEISMQVSVLDSKLEAVDIIVTMDNFEKKWQTLKPWLVSLESMPTKSNVEILHGEKGARKSFDTTFESDEINKSLLVISSMSTSKLSSDFPLEETKSSPNVKSCQPSLLLNSSSTIQNIGDSSTNSNQLTDEQIQNEMDESGVTQSTPSLSLPINIEDFSDNSSKSSDYQEKTNKHKVIESSTTDTDKNEQKCEDASDTSSTASSNKTAKNDPKVPNKSVDLLENKTQINNTSQCKVSLPQSVTNFYIDLFFNSRKDKSYTSGDLNGFNEPRISSELQTTNNLEAVRNSNERGDCKTVTPSDDYTSKSDGKSSEMYEPENVIQIKQESADIEKEYVIVQTKDIEAATQHVERDVLSSTGILSPSSIDKDLQVCSNMTEYLEVNLEQKEDETYKFAFTPFSFSNSKKYCTTTSEIQEASYPLFSPLLNGRTNENELKLSLTSSDPFLN